MVLFFLLQLIASHQFAAMFDVCEVSCAKSLPLLCYQDKAARENSSVNVVVPNGSFSLRQELKHQLISGQDLSRNKLRGSEVVLCRYMFHNLLPANAQRTRKDWSHLAATDPKPDLERNSTDKAGSSPTLCSNCAEPQEELTENHFNV